ncbi:trace amine-associated receptor 13c-like [Girardinichthys multiradiatus]|uniref:trace amine-associated receptor 13c-like n=1 Tax=Girardinichthys multiradiatus TaxID=208333 RepID=UPI001FAE020D|nr:trace amine-associated receptor 13c-like [Girardinichthys multiradiatus]
MDGSKNSSLCFPNHNSSCRRLLLPLSETVLFHTLLTLISLLTVMLNLLVIISISHFRQLHNPTNSLLLSLAVSDLAVGLLVMPIEGLRYLETCWLLGSLMCALTPYVFYCLITASLGHMVLISVDRYVAICDPLLYPTRITMINVKICVSLCWVCSLLYNGLILMGHLGQPDRFSTCHGECVVVISRALGTVDLFFTFIAPCTVMVYLYFRVLLAALSQVRLIRSQTAATAVKSAQAVTRSEWKAARSLAIVIAVFIMCYFPFFYPSLEGKDTSSSLSYFSALTWIMLLNSCMNPIIYVLFYPWFRKAIKLILTLKIQQPDSCDMKMM